MKKTTLSLIASLIACSTLFSSVSWADGPGDQRWQQHGGDQHQDHGRGPDHGGDRGPDHGNNRGPDRGPDHHDRMPTIAVQMDTTTAITSPGTAMTSVAVTRCRQNSVAHTIA